MKAILPWGLLWSNFFVNCVPYNLARNLYLTPNPKLANVPVDKVDKTSVLFWTPKALRCTTNTDQRTKWQKNSDYLTIQPKHWMVVPTQRFRGQKTSSSGRNLWSRWRGRWPRTIRPSQHKKKWMKIQLENLCVLSLRKQTRRPHLCQAWVHQICICQLQVCPHHAAVFGAWKPCLVRRHQFVRSGRQQAPSRFNRL